MTGWAATSRAFPPSEPSFALFKNGELVAFIPKFRIQDQAARRRPPTCVPRSRNTASSHDHLQLRPPRARADRRRARCLRELDRRTHPRGPLAPRAPARPTTSRRRPGRPRHRARTVLTRVSVAVRARRCPAVSG
ncbi:BrxA/BrxB family bacilliredoxin [Streptomyces sp. NPDC058659]|uniref:BrxA/BrxB family bacilliredoxin n=1 Tax=unclassified Streptomyces TaxID=2593676 RepID=UPI00365B91D9